MKNIYNRISEDMTSVEDSKDYYREDLLRYGFTVNEIRNCEDDDLVEMLNEIDMYGCGDCFYLVDENIIYSELLKVINN